MQPWESRSIKKVSVSWSCVREILESPKRLLFVDVFGALVTFIVTAFLFATERIPTGLPVNILCLMACAVGGFFLTGLIGLLFVTDPRNLLRWMATLNLTYCLATSVLCVVFSSALTKWGLAYFPAEIVVVAILAFWELRVSGRPITDQRDGKRCLSDVKVGKTMA